MLIDDLQRAMQHAVEAQPFSPDLTGIRERQERIQRQRRTLAAGATGLVIAAAATITVVASWTTGGPGEVATAGQSQVVAAAIEEVDRWGATRGSLATDTAFLDRAVAEWQHPHPGYYGELSDTHEISTAPDGTKTDSADQSRHLVGNPKVLWAGTDPGNGGAAVVAQRSGNPDAGIYFGFLMSEAGQLTLVAQYTPTWFPFGEGAERAFDTHVIAFQTGPSGKNAVILPANPSDEVSISRSHTVDSSGRVHRTWQPVYAQTDGAATVAAAHGFRDALVRVREGGATIDVARVWDVLTGTSYEDANAQPSAPANVVSLPLSDQFIGGSVPGGGYTADYQLAWVRRYADAEEPFGEERWTSGSPQPHDVIVVEQLWFEGGPAHTVVIRIVNNNVQVLEDTVTDPSARPLVFRKLPDGEGWLVVGGPNTTVTGWRLPGAKSWTPVETSTAATSNGKPITTRAASFVHSAAPHIEVQLEVNGQTRVASR